MHAFMGILKSFAGIKRLKFNVYVHHIIDKMHVCLS